MRSFGAAVATLSVLFLATGLVWPHLAGRLFAILLASLSVAWVGARAYRSRLPAVLTSDAYSPFDRRPSELPVLAYPAPIHDLATRLRALDDPRDAERFAIPLTVGNVVAEEAARRLAAGRDLAFDDPSHLPRIRALVSEPMWALIGPDAAHAQRPLLRDPVPIEHLPGILDELERL